MRPTQEKIRSERCPICDEGVVEYMIGRQHTNGEWNERVEYQCGCVLVYSPNFRSVEVKINCPNAHRIAAELIFEERKRA